MGTVAEIPLQEKIEQRETEAAEAKSRKEEALQHWEQAKVAGGLSSRNAMRLGWHIHQLEKKNLWGMLGYRDKHEAREDSEISDSSWFANARLAECYDGLVEELFCGMKQINAKAMADLPQSKRMSLEWIEKASKMKTAPFAAAIDEEMTGKARDSDSKERTTILKMPMPASRQKSIEFQAKEYAERVGLPAGDTGHAIEVALVEANSGSSLVEVILKAVRTIKELQDLFGGNMSNDELLEKYQDANAQMLTEFATALAQKGEA